MGAPYTGTGGSIWRRDVSALDVTGAEVGEVAGAEVGADAARDVTGADVGEVAGAEVGAATGAATSVDS